jgi:predicted nucleic acid-binding protein
VSLGRVFVDTGAWFALQATDDSYHRIASETLEALLEVAQTLVTSNVVIGETYTLLRLSKGYRQAKRFLDATAHSERLECVFLTTALERTAYEILHQYSGHPFSYVDATSFALMRDQKIRYAFAFDAHFATAGFFRIPVDFRLSP